MPLCTKFMGVVGVIEISIKPEMGEKDDLHYMGYLIDKYLNPEFSFSEPPTDYELEAESNSTALVILICSGLVPPEFFLHEIYVPQSLEKAMFDFIINFYLLYPHLAHYSSEPHYWANLNRRELIWTYINE